MKRLIARLLLEELDADLITALRAPAIAGVLDRMEPGCGAWLREPWDETREDAVREEFARLFLLPGGTPPFARAWIEGERENLGAQLATFVSRALVALGREPQPSHVWGRLPLDHLGLLFEFTAAAFESEDRAGREIGAHLQREALGPWIGAFGRALRAKARLPIYRAVGGLLEELSYGIIPVQHQRSHGKLRRG